MSFNWLDKFTRESGKPEDYAEKTLKAYRLGMKAKGSIAGVRIVPDPQGCPMAQQLDSKRIYHPDDAPIIPLAACDRGSRCGCVYRPVMTYELAEESGETDRDAPVESA